MKKATTLLAIITLTVIAGCGGGKQSTDDLITVDVTKSYPKKELVLQDIFDVEYILLDDTNDEFVTNGIIMSIGKEIILVRNVGTSGDILVFDRNGKGLRKVNRRGQGAEEYPMFLRATLDEENNAMFVYGASPKRLVVYDLFGNFIRSLVLNDNRFMLLGNFDRDNLICFDDIEFDERRNRFWIISKLDGSVSKEIHIPYKERITRRIADGNGTFIADGPRNQILIPNRDSWILVEPSADTIYRLLPDYRIVPFIVRTPSVQSMSPEVFLFPSVLTDRYIFIQTVKKETDLTIRERLYPRRDLMYDKQEKALFEYIVYNADFTTKIPVNLAFETYGLPFLNNEIAFMYKLESFELVDAFRKGQLRGKLKEIAAELNAESNPVIMIAKHKK